MLTSYTAPQIFPHTQAVYIPILGEIQGAKIEIPATLSDAHALRKQAFVAGRICAQGVCEKLGIQHATVGQDVSGRPQFPAGIVGSISHSSEYAFSIAGKEGDWYSLGIDVEKINTSARKLEAIVKKMLTAREIEKWGGDPHAILAIFTLKEAAFKCVNWTVPCRTNSFEVLEMGPGRVEIRMREAKLELPLIGYTEVAKDLQHHVSIVGIQAGFLPNRF